MPLSWVLADALEQLDALSCQRRVLEGERKFDEGINRDLQVVAKSLQEHDVKAGLTALQQWICNFVSRDEVEDVLNILLDLYDKYCAQSWNPDRGSGKQPSKGDKVVTIDDITDDSLDFFVFDTMHKVIQSVLRKSETVEEALIKVPEAVFASTFRHLHHAYPQAVRFSAASCLALLSQHYLGKIVKMFMARAKKLSKDADYREYASYQQMVGLLAFNIKTEADDEVTMNYLHSLRALMKKADRGVLRSAICETIEAIYAKLCGLGEDHATWQQYLSQMTPSKAESFWKLWWAMYSTVHKWSKKSKHTVFCYSVMWKMTVLGGHTFYDDSKREDIVALLVAGWKKSELRFPCLEFARDYVKAIPIQLVRRDTATFTHDLKLFVGSIFPAKSKGLDLLHRGQSLEKNLDEQNVIVELLTWVGRKHINFFVNEVVVKEFEDAGCTLLPLHQSLILRALADIASDSPEVVEKYDYALGPIVANLLEHAEQHIVAVTRAAVRCFPDVRQPSDERNAMTAEAIGRLALHSDREVSSSAAMALQKYILLNPQEHLIKSSFHFTDLLLDFEGLEQTDLLKTCQNINFLLQSVRERVDSPEFITYGYYLALREHIEALSVVWLCHHETWIRHELYRLLQLLGCKELMVIESGAEEEPTLSLKLEPETKLEDSDTDDEMERQFNEQKAREAAELEQQRRAKEATLTEKALLFSSTFRPLLCKLIDKPLMEYDDGSSLFSPLLHRLITEHYDEYRGILQWVWGQLWPRVQVALLPDAETNLSYPDWTSLWLNHMHFLCIAMRAPPENMDGLFYTTRYTELAFDGDGSELAFTQRTPDRPQLNRFRVSEKDIKEFLRCVYRFLHSNSPKFQPLRSTIAKSLAQCHPSCYALVITTWNEEWRASADVNAKKQASHDDYFYHEHTMDLLQRIFGKIDPNEFHFMSPVLRETLERCMNFFTREAADKRLIKLSAQLKYCVAKLLEVHLLVMNSDNLEDKEMMKELTKANRAMYFAFVRDKHILPPARPAINEQERDVRERLDVQVARVFYAMFQLGAFEDEALENDILGLLNCLPLRGDHVEDVVAETLEAMLQTNPHRLEDFMKFASPEAERHLDKQHAPRTNTAPLSRVRSQSIVFSQVTKHLVHREEEQKPFASKLSVLYVRAVVRNFVDNLEHWIKVQRVSKATMLVFSMLHQFSNTKEARLLAVTLAQALQKRDQDPFDPGFPVVIFTHDSPFIYNHSVLAYSRALAAQPENALYISSLLEAVVGIMTYANTAHKEMLLRVVIPWVCQFGPMLGELSTESSETVMQYARSILNSMFSLTRQCHGTSNLSYLLNDMWISLFTFEKHHNLVVPEIVEFFVYESMKAAYHSNSGDSDEALLKMIFVHLTRSKAAAQITEHLMKEFRRYFDQAPTDPEEFLKYETTRKAIQEDVSPSEHVAFILVADLVYENGQLFLKYFPLLLQNAFVLFGGMQTSEGRSMLMSIQLALGIYDQSNPQTEDNLIKALSDKVPSLKESWKRMAFRWAINSCDQRVATRSFNLFKKLHRTAIRQAYIARLSLSFFLSLHSKEDDKVIELVEIFNLPTPANVEPQKEVWQTMCTLGFSLTKFPSVRLFESGIKLINTILNVNVPVDKLKAWLLEMTLWGDSKQKMDEVVVEFVLRGLTSKQTIQASLDVIQRLGMLSVTELPENNSLVLLLLLGNLMLSAVNRLKLQRSGQTVQSDSGSDPVEQEQRLRQESILAFVALLDTYSEVTMNATFRHLKFYLLNRPGTLTPQQQSPIPSPKTKRRKHKGSNARNAHRGSVELLDALNDVFHFEPEPVKKPTVTALSPLRPSASHMAFALNLPQTPELKSPSDTQLDTPPTPDGKDEPVHLWVRKILETFFNEYSGRHVFDFIYKFLVDMLSHGPGDWKPVVLMMIANVLELSTHLPTKDQTIALCELLVQHYFSKHAETKALAEAVSTFLVQNVQLKAGHEAFNFLRKVTSSHESLYLMKQGSYLLDSSSAPTKDIRADSCQMIKTHVFPLLKALALTADPLVDQKETEETAKEIRDIHRRASMISLTQARQIENKLGHNRGTSTPPITVSPARRPRVSPRTQSSIHPPRKSQPLPERKPVVKSPNKDEVKDRSIQTRFDKAEDFVGTPSPIASPIKARFSGIDDSSEDYSDTSSSDGFGELTTSPN